MNTIGQSLKSSVKPLASCRRSIPVARSIGLRGVSRFNSVRIKADPIDTLRQESSVLKDTIQETKTTIEELEEGISKAGASQNVDGMGISVSTSLTPADFWTPAIEVPEDHVFEEEYGPIHSPPMHDGTDCFRWDNQLWGVADHFKYRWSSFCGLRAAIDQSEGGLDKFSQGYKFFGFNRGIHEGKEGIWYREWAPGAKALALVGEFNGWQPRDTDWAIKNSFGVWELFLPDNPNGSSQIKHRTKLKCRVEAVDGQWLDKIPAWIKWAFQDPGEIPYNGIYYEPPSGESPPGELDPEMTYTFKYPRPPKPRALRIYECHVGMSSAEPKVNSYNEFRRDMLPRIREAGYNAIQIMAIQEHAYYGSFGYHVTNFFAASSRFGTPDELKALIDEAHHLGLVVLMDLVHSHASKNTMDGINMFDGTDGMYFHGGERGNHWMWDSRLFNYGNWETLRFLLSNCRWWMDEYKFDGYRFDGVTSMLYHHHGLQYTFTGNYGEYFGLATDVDACVYLMLMNHLLHNLFPTAITVGEDVSGMPALCRPWYEGGIGFDYRLQMAIADKWIEVLKTKNDQEWDLGDIVHTLTNRRYAEPCVSYAESHDQALVGDKTIAFWLMDKEMYDCMAAPGYGPQSPLVDRGCSLHKMIRLVTMVLGGEGYLNFMGNEFGHPEWIDFPRSDSYDPSTGAFVPGNGGSLDKCRRRWDLCDSEILRYKDFNLFDRAITHLEKAFGFVSAPHDWVSRKDNGDKMLVCERGDLVFVFNFHPTSSFTDYKVGCKLPGPYKVVLSSDEKCFGGYENVTKKQDVTFPTGSSNHDGRPHDMMVYAPSRTVVVYAPAETCDPHADSKPWGIPGLGVKERGPYFAR